jgi:hypothetical protein
MAINPRIQSQAGHKRPISVEQLRLDEWIAIDLCGSAASDNTRRSAIRDTRAASALVAIMYAANVACAQEVRPDPSTATNPPPSPTQGEASV